MQLARGRRLVELLKQPAYSPYKVEDQIASIFAATNGYVDTYPESDVRKYEKEMLEYLKTKFGHILKSIADQKVISPDIKTQLVGALDEFKAVFQTSK
jgi:F-type H+-transporting ATPase subunit alpha